MFPDVFPTFSDVLFDKELFFWNTLYMYLHSGVFQSFVLVPMFSRRFGLQGVLAVPLVCIGGG